MDPVLLSVVSVVAAVVAVGAVVVGVARTAAHSRTARSYYRTALYAAEDAKGALEQESSATRAARADLRAAQARADENAEEMKQAAETMQDAIGGIDDTMAAMDKYQAITEGDAAEADADDADADTDIAGHELLVPTRYATWTEDGDFQYVQVTLWPTKGGLTVTTALNAASETANFSWKEWDAVTNMAAALRPLDDEAPEPLELVELDPETQLPKGCGGPGCANCPNEAHCRKTWAAVTGSHPNKFEDPDLIDE